MKFNKGSLPYPVLGIGDDILPIPTKPSFKLAEDKQFFYFDIEVYLENEEILDLIAKKKARYILEIDCVTTAFRQCIKSGKPHMIIKIPRQKLGGNISIVCTVGVVQEIPNYQNSHFHEDYDGFNFSLETGDVLAVLCDFECPLDIEYDKLQAVGSFMEITKGRDDVPTSFVLSGDKIEIKLPPVLFNQYRDHVKNKAAFANIIHSSLVYNALIYALYNLEDYRGTRWARALDTRIKTEEKLRKYSLDDSTTFQNLANELLGNPYERLFNSLDAISEKMLNIIGDDE